MPMHIIDIDSKHAIQMTDARISNESGFSVQPGVGTSNRNQLMHVLPGQMKQQVRTTHFLALFAAPVFALLFLQQLAMDLGMVGPDDLHVVPKTFKIPAPSSRSIDLARSSSVWLIVSRALSGRVPFVLSLTCSGDRQWDIISPAE